MGAFVASRRRFVLIFVVFFKNLSLSEALFLIFCVVIIAFDLNEGFGYLCDAQALPSVPIPAAKKHTFEFLLQMPLSTMCLALQQG